MGLAGGLATNGVVANAGSVNLTAEKMCILGHSGAEPYGTKHPYTWPAKLALALGAEEINYAVSGAVMALEDNNTQNPLNIGGGYGCIWNAVLPTLTALGPNSQRQLRDRSQLPPNSTSAFIPFADVYTIFHGAMDLHWASATLANSLQVLKSSFEHTIARCRAGAFFNDDDTTAFNYGGASWTAFGWGTLNTTLTKGSGHLCTAAGASNFVEFTVPACYDGGEIAFYFVTGGASGGQITFTGPAGLTFPDGSSLLDMSGVTTQVASNPNSHTSPGTGICKRMKLKVTGATQVIRATVTAFTGTNFGTGIAQTLFDGVTIEATQVPRVMLITHPFAAVQGAVAGSLRPTVTNADFAQHNSMLYQLTRTPYWSDGYVMVADMQALWARIGADQIQYGAPLSPWFSDNAHLNEYGHGLVTKLCLDTLTSGPTPAARAGLASLTYRQVGLNSGGNAEPAYGAGWSSAGSGTGNTIIGGMEFAKDPAGVVHLRGYAKKTTPANGDTIVTLPVQYRPAEDTGIMLVATQAGTGTIEIDAAGNVTYRSGTTSTWMSFAGVTYLADGGSNP